ncbi:MAG: alanine racemase [Alphaproteobacteria bacterium]|nr:MAG: alanine racemase [Alphaproteobacteria bacterium]
MTDAIGPPESEAGGILTIDLAAIAANWRALGHRAAPAKCAAVVKADGYGCGIEQVASALARAGCETFFVANLTEARRVRAVAPNAAIYVLNGLLPGTAAAYAEANLRPVLGSTAEFDEWRAFRAASGWNGAAALHIDTGMNRLGFAQDEAATLAERGDNDLGIALVMSHFACSEEDHPLNALQMTCFRAVRALFPDVPGSLANSSGIFLGPDAHHELVRPGVALYGANPTPGQPNPMQPVVALEGRIVQLRAVAPGATVGYSATWTARRPTRLAIVSVGYADGFLRAASASDARPGAEAIVAGQRCPLAGRVSMDLIAIDVTDVPDRQISRGDLVSLLGAEIGVDELAARAGTIGYEVLTSLGRRYRRIYRA